VGLVVTLEAPSALSVGLCLAHMVTDKRAWLERLGAEVEAGWPMSGKPAELYVDNAAEFKSEALRRGCDQHGIKLCYRPVGQPHYGIIERVVGTMMQMIHELPGTTFSNPQQRGGYDSEATAVLTVREVERWLVLAIATYHGQVHATLGQTPAGRWAEGVAAAGAPATVTNEVAFLVDFLPVLRRTLTRTGFVIDHVHYFCDALKPWIARRERLDRFVLRRDPRDISRVWIIIRQARQATAQARPCRLATPERPSPVDADGPGAGVRCGQARHVWQTLELHGQVSTRSQARSASCRYWVVRNTVVPWRLSFRNRPHRALRDCGSSPVVGSSRNRSAGRCTSAWARSSRRRSPPDSRLARWLATSARENASSSSAARLQDLSCRTPCRKPVMARFSAAVRSSSTLTDWPA
jgi:hypothetical protein